MNDTLRQRVADERGKRPRLRITRLLDALEIKSSTWYPKRITAGDPKRRGRRSNPLPAKIEHAVVTMATDNPWYGYKRIAVMCRRDGSAVTDRQAYRVMKAHGLLRKRRTRDAEVYQAAKLFELLPSGPNQLWQMDVTYIHIPGRGWWYAVTVIDYYSRYLLAAHLTSSYAAGEAIEALRIARAEAERIHGPLPAAPHLVTDNGPTFIAKRFVDFVRDAYQQVRIRYRTPTQLGLLERFHRTLKEEEVYWRLYDSPAHARECLGEFRARYNQRRPHWALAPESGGDPLTPEEVYESGVAIAIPHWQAWARAARAKLDQMIEPAA